MSVEIVVPGPDDFAAAMAPTWQSFGMTELDDDELSDGRLFFDASSPLAARMDGQFVGLTADYPFHMTLPGGATTPVAGVTEVGVRPTHRRRGLLTALMARQLDEVADRGDAMAILTASESTIYGRFGYGPATIRTETAVETARSSFAVAPAPAGRCRILDKAEGLPLVKSVYDACRTQRAGTVDRADFWWEFMRRDRKSRRDGASPQFYVVHDDASGQPDGYALYRIKEKWDDHGLPRDTLIAREVVGASVDVEATLWRFLYDVDLVERVECWLRPLDDPLRWRLSEPRRLQTISVSDWLWLRVLDVPRALELRRYEREGRIVIEVVDTFRPASGGCFALEAGPDGAACQPTTESPDITLGAPEFGAIYLGGAAPSLLATAGRIDEHTPEALVTADALFTTRTLPFSNTGF